MTPPGDLTQRLWRARRRHHHIDALVCEAEARWQLVFRYDDRQMLTWLFTDREAAAREAAGRLRDLQRAGWTVHW